MYAIPHPARSAHGACRPLIRRCILAGIAWLPCSMTLAASDISISKTVNDPTLMPGAAVEFTITVRNHGPDATNAAQATDQLPPGLVIPTGVVPYTSQGFYDADTGRWLVDDLAVGASAVLVLPAVVTAEPLPVCIVNEAFADRLADDPNPDNEYAAAALRGPGIERCIDLSVSVGPLWLADPICEASTRVLFTVSVGNYGADAARDVRVELDVDPDIIPGLQFTDPVCGPTPAPTCVIDELGPGQVLNLSLSSNRFRNGTGRNVTITATATTPDPVMSPFDDTQARTSFLPKFEDCDWNIDLGTGSSSCFIATAAYGSSMDPHVLALREFRDRFLLTNAPGRAFVDAYYRLSPPLAAYISSRPGLRATARAILWPIVFAVVHPAASALALAGLAALLGYARRHHRRRTRLHSAGAREVMP